MALTWKKSEENTLGVDLGNRDYYGLSSESFDAYLFDKEGSVTQIDDLAEIVKPIDDPVSCKASGDTAKGSVEIAVDDVSGWEVGMVAKVKDKEIYFYVKEINSDDNKLIARNEIADDIADGDEIDQVGNTGVYSTKITIDDVGTYFVVVNNPSIDFLNKARKLRVVEHLTEDVYSKVSDEAGNIKDKMDDVKKELEDKIEDMGDKILDDLSDLINGEILL